MVSKCQAKLLASSLYTYMNSHLVYRHACSEPKPHNKAQACQAISLFVLPTDTTLRAAECNGLPLLPLELQGLLSTDWKATVHHSHKSFILWLCDRSLNR